MMEEKTYTFYDVCKTLYELEYGGKAPEIIRYKKGKRRKPKNTEADGLNFLDFRNWKLKQYNRLKMAAGIPRYPHRDTDDVHQFSEDKYLETLFTLYYYDTPFMSKTRSMHAISLDVVEDINERFRTFITALFSDVYSEAEINKHIEIFSYATALDHEIIYDKIKKITEDHLNVTLPMINWLNHTRQKLEKSLAKAMNNATSSAQDENELLDILKQYHPSYEDLTHPRESNNLCPLLNYHDKSIILQRYLDLIENLILSRDITEVEKSAHLLDLNMQYKKIIHIFKEIRDEEITDFSLYLVDNNYPEEDHKEYLFTHMKTSIDALSEAIDEYIAKENHRNRPQPTENDLQELEDFFSKSQDR